MKRYNQHVATGTADGVTAGLTVSGNTLFLGNNYKEVADLSAVVTVDAETDTLTFAPLWQVSNDNSTWLNVAHSPANEAATVLATGTSGADASVTKVVPAPEGVDGYQYARLALVVGATDGNTADTYSIGYSYRKLTGAEFY